MAFQNIVMPKLKLIHGVTKQVVDPVTVIGNGSRETRRKQNRYERFVWRFPARSLLQESKQELYSFFKTTDAALDSFMFQDPDYPEFVNMPLISKVDGGSNPTYVDCWYFDIYDGTTNPHPLFNHPDTSLITFMIADTEVLSFGTVEYHAVSGRPFVRLLDSYAISASNGNASPQLTGPCYITARLNSPLTWTISAMDKSPNGTTCTPTPVIVDMGDIELIEVFERA